MNLFITLILLYMQGGDLVEFSLLIKHAKNGDKEALLELIVAQKADYYKLAYVYMKNEDDAMDAMQDMIIILYENISKLRKDESFYSWSKTILVNCCKNKIKKNNRLVSIDEIREENDENVIENPEEKIALESYLSRLSFKHQEVIRLRYYLDLDYESISEMLKIPLGTVKSRLNSAMKYLKESIGGEYLE